MSIDKILVGLGGVSVILFVAWFFFAKAGCHNKLTQFSVGSLLFGCETLRSSSEWKRSTTLCGP